MAWAHVDLKPNTTHDLCFGEVFRGVLPDEEVKYKINSNGHRCDEFSKNHTGAHALFTGCSNTFGEGLPYLKNWSGRLYEKISKEESLSGYYNLSYLGGSINLIIDNIYKYINTFGAPKYLFCHFPETKRYIKYKEKNTYFNYVNYDFNSLDKQKFMDGYLAIRSLEEYCKAKGINLFWNTWYPPESNEFLKIKSLKRFVYCDWPEIFAMSNCSNEDKSSKYYAKARDNVHPGYQYSDGVSNIFYERFKDEKDKNLLV